MFSSWVLENLLSGSLFRLNYGKNTIGRSTQCTIRPTSLSTSKMHADIYVNSNTETAILTDMNGTNGTYINDIVYKGKTIQLQDGDRIGFGAIATDEEIMACDEENAHCNEYAIFKLKCSPRKRIQQTIGSKEGNNNNNKNEKRLKKQYDNVKVLGTFELSDDSEDEDKKPQNPKCQVQKTIIDIFGDDDFPAAVKMDLAINDEEKNVVEISDDGKGVHRDLKIISVEHIPKWRSPLRADQTSPEPDENIMLSQQLLNEFKEEFEEFHEEGEDEVLEVEAGKAIKEEKFTQDIIEIEDSDDDDQTLAWKEKIFSQSLRVDDDEDDDDVVEVEVEDIGFMKEILDNYKVTIDENNYELPKKSEMPTICDKVTSPKATTTPSPHKYSRLNLFGEETLPEVISAPALPPHRGKHRGISANTPKKPALDRLKSLEKEKDMRTKFLQGPRKTTKKDSKSKEERSAKLRELALTAKKAESDDDVVRVVSLPKCKVTKANRGAFLVTENPVDEEKSKVSRKDSRSKDTNKSEERNKKSEERNKKSEERNKKSEERNKKSDDRKNKSDDRNKQSDERHRSSDKRKSDESKSSHRDSKRRKINENEKSSRSSSKSSHTKNSTESSSEIGYRPPKMTFKSIEVQPIIPNPSGPLQYSNKPNQTIAKPTVLDVAGKIMSRRISRCAANHFEDPAISSAPETASKISSRRTSRYVENTSSTVLDAAGKIMSRRISRCSANPFEDAAIISAPETAAKISSRRSSRCVENTSTISNKPRETLPVVAAKITSRRGTVTSLNTIAENNSTEDSVARVAASISAPKRRGSIFIETHPAAPMSTTALKSGLTPVKPKFLALRKSRHSMDVVSMENPARISARRCSQLSIQNTFPLIPRLKSSKTPTKNIKKSVTFNEKPEIFYFERDFHLQKPLRKVDQKDLILKPSFTYKERATINKRKYPIVDNSDAFISEIISWDPNWLYTGKHEIHGPDQMAGPILHQFASFDVYRSILLPLLKEEIWAQIDNAYLPREKSIGANIEVDSHQVLERTSGNRIALCAKYFLKFRKDVPDVGIGNSDIVCLHIGDSTEYVKCFGYVAVLRKCFLSNLQYLHLQIEIKFNEKVQKILEYCKKIRVEVVVRNGLMEINTLNAVEQISHSPLAKKILNPLKIIEQPTPSIENVAYKGANSLNEVQKRTLLETYMRSVDTKTPTISLINGPPGTGKTRLISNMVSQFLHGKEVKPFDQKILVCAQSNGAVDVIARSLFSMRRKQQNMRVLRFAEPERVHNDIKGITLTNIIKLNYDAEREKNPKFKSMLEEKKRLNMQIAAIESTKADNYQQDQIAGLKERIKNIDRHCKISPLQEEKMKEYYLKNSHVVCSTLSRCGLLAKYIQYFDICIIDEATQATEPSTLNPLRFGINSLILVGDSRQLPATVISQNARKNGLATSLFTRIEDCLSESSNNPIATLRTQYRMHPEISLWPNLYFYKNLLQNGEDTKCDTIVKPFSIFSLNYSQNEKCGSGKIVNNLEADFVTKLVLGLNKIIPSQCYSYGIITPYADHRDRLEHTLRKSGIKHLMVNTVDSYQGCEKDVIIISNARTKGVGFLDNSQRLNVALTRAKKCLILCGNFSNLEGVPVWKSLINNAKQRDLMYSISPTDVEEFEANVLSKISTNLL